MHLHAIAVLVPGGGKGASIGALDCPKMLTPFKPEVFVPEDRSELYSGSKDCPERLLSVSSLGLFLPGYMMGKNGQILRAA